MCVCVCVCGGGKFVRFVPSEQVYICVFDLRQKLLKKREEDLKRREKELLWKKG